MRQQHRLTRAFALTATAATLAMALALAMGLVPAFGAEVTFAKTETKAATYYEDSRGNLCVGLPTETLFAGSCEWEGVTGEANVAIGFRALNSDTIGYGNVASGFAALSSNTTGIFNVASGWGAMVSNTGGIQNAASGTDALFSNTTGTRNVANGEVALFSNTTGSRNVASGGKALFTNTSGGFNVASGFNALVSNTTGSSNVAIGSFAGALATGSNNIDVANEGVAGEEGTTRVGTEGTQKKAFVAGIYPEHVSGCTVQVTSEAQLGCNPTAGATGAAIATFTSFGGVPSGHCLNFGDPAAQGQGKCTGAPPGWSKEKTLVGPIPDNGADVSYLHAETEKRLAGTESATLEVIDNNVVLLACAVHAPNKSCTAGVGGAASSGDNLEVRVTAIPANGSGDDKPWRVSFRY